MSNLTVFAGEYDGKAIRVTEDGLFSVFDVLVAFIPPSERKGKQAEGINPRQVLKSITARNPEVVQVLDNFKFPGRGQKNTPVASEEGIYEILMLCPGDRGTEFRRFAATVLRERREEESDPELAYIRGKQRAINVWRKQGKTDEEIAAQIRGIESRNYLTDTLRDHGVKEGWQYAAITNGTYLELFGGTAQELKQERGLSKADRLRDDFDLVETQSLGLIEAIGGQKIRLDGRKGYLECKDATDDAARRVRRVFED